MDDKNRPQQSASEHEHAVGDGQIQEGPAALGFTLIILFHFCIIMVKDG